MAALTLCLSEQTLFLLSEANSTFNSKHVGCGSGFNHLPAATTGEGCQPDLHRGSNACDQLLSSQHIVSYRSCAAITQLAVKQLRSYSCTRTHAIEHELKE
ncbi:MAG: hypothetical protein CMM07_05845 [Rhodopirellula sp.]|nr:hypothetical protein [Rhodopirellula sp.]